MPPMMVLFDRQIDPGALLFHRCCECVTRISKKAGIISYGSVHVPVSPPGNSPHISHTRVCRSEVDSDDHLPLILIGQRVVRVATQQKKK